MNASEFAQSPFVRDYVKALDQLREKYGLDDKQMQEQVVRFHFPEQWFLKSGFGDIGRLPYPDRVVEADRSKNNITIDRKSKKLWLGEGYETPQLVLIEGDNVLFTKRYSGKEASRDLTLVLFNPERVDFFYWQEFQGGSFKRTPNK